MSAEEGVAPQHPAGHREANGDGRILRDPQAAEQVPKPDLRVAMDFLEKLRPGGPWVLTSISVDGGQPRTRTFDSSTIADAKAWIPTENAARRGAACTCT